MSPGQDPAALQALARHAEAIATVREFAERAGAERVTVLADRGDARQALMLEWAGDGSLELIDDEARSTIPGDSLVPAPPRPLPDVRAVPPTAIEADPASGEVAAPLGAIASLGRAVLGLAKAFGGRSVASVELPTRDPQLPITIVAREGEPLLLAVGDGRFELPLPD
jgi:hypothetical protein